MGVFAVIVWTGSLYAQPEPSFPRSVKGILWGGLVASQVDGDNYSGYRKLGPAGGIGALYPFSGFWFFQLLLGYVQKGSWEPYRYLFRAHYVDISVLIGWKDAGPVAFLGGITFARLLGFREIIGGRVVQYAVSPFRSMDILFTARLDWYIRRGFAVGVTFQRSLRSIRKDRAPYPVHRLLLFTTSVVLFPGKE